jgi:hypothetical protein
MNLRSGGYEFENTVFRDESVIYCGGCHLHWGHFLIETVQRLWYVIQKNRKLKIVFAAYEQYRNYKFKENFSRFFNLLDIPNEQIEIIYEPTTFKSVIVPEQSMRPGEWCTKEYEKIFEYISRSVDNLNLKLEQYDKIYFSRTMFGIASKREIGEKAIESAFEINGFKIMYPEQLKLEELVYYMHTVKTVACISGTLSHNILFSGNNSINWINLNKSHFPLIYQYAINDMINGNMVHIDVYKEPLPGFPVSLGPGPFWYTITDELKAFFTNENMVIPTHYSRWFDIFIYIKMCVRLSLSMRKNKLLNNLRKRE